MSKKLFKPFLGKSQVELDKLMAEKRSALRQFNFNVAGGKLANVKEARRLRQDIARILTLKNAETK